MVTAPETGAKSLVLVVEHQPTNQLLIRRMLEKLGYRADHVVDGRGAVEASARTRYDAILMDCQRETEAYEATVVIRRGEAAGGPHTPIIALTAQAKPEDRERALREEWKECVSSPVNNGLVSGVCSRDGSLRSGARADPRRGSARAPDAGDLRSWPAPRTSLHCRRMESLTRKETGTAATRRSRWKEKLSAQSHRSGRPRDATSAISSDNDDVVKMYDSYLPLKASRSRDRSALHALI